MAEHHEPAGATSAVPWRERSPEEHGRALANLMLYVSAAPRRPNGERLTFPVLKHIRSSS
ncbi:MAG: hypothetical protein ACRDZR_10020 [Acidimicrobiales bacterium]